MRTLPSRTRLGLALAAASLTTASCTGGINAGEEGGLAFIVFAGMLVAFLAIMWLIIGRED